MARELPRPITSSDFYRLAILEEIRGLREDIKALTGALEPIAYPSVDPGLSLGDEEPGDESPEEKAGSHIKDVKEPDLPKKHHASKPHKRR